jgi:hypothetical protein
MGWVGIGGEGVEHSNFTLGVAIIIYYEHSQMPMQYNWYSGLQMNI